MAGLASSASKNGKRKIDKSWKGACFTDKMSN